ncbi:undecaprenyldiphospho-muramoylpentapeptide beta-N-acetylglucosaminyltransferase [Gallaecimonas kandeliae]|uniref:undecaprenyldiphospho-muramoylpentapeptide beta-N-acetylglucosaminyltransferase n=1 Tax=Gallaecimonas kandeliae TaxID=3029055 RepID=UPI002649DBD1|nr:undecaprenyldiphospho-muramoylpentapeptide beta-N-acetylglucosaminyltransferase [Gallaecimonas kandeliae]WKE66085.1 undecaprenyldiphospho-muramoylpentapeptide beta-N-acetylglucosaminyltransferase [Gallaecimonas kandeliae]
MKRLMVMAGGTGGHIFPALAVAQQLQKEGWLVDWLGTPSRMEADLVPKYDIPLHFVHIEGVRGNGLKRLLVTPFKLVKAVWDAWRLFGRLQPAVVLGMGGFASGPGGIAARLRGIPLVLHEQNAVAGVTNRYLAKVASKVLQAFPGAFDKAPVVGNPIRELLFKIERHRHSGPLRVLVIGGSLGAQVFNEVLPEAFAKAGVPLDVFHQTGKGRSQAVQQRYDELGFEAKVSDFVDDMAAAYGWADVAICRAGALTVSELAAVGLPSILVPLPIAVDDHQTQNARFLTEHHGALLLPQPQLNAERVASLLREWHYDPEQLATMGEQAHRQAKPDATEAVASVCRHLAGYEKSERL